MTEKKKDLGDYIISIVGINGLVITGKYLFHLILGVMAIEWVIENLVVKNPLAQAMIYSSLFLIPVYIFALAMEDIGGDDEVFMGVTVVLILVGTFAMRFFS